MRSRTKRGIVAALAVMVIGVVGFVILVLRPGPSDLLPPSDAATSLNIPRTFDDAAMASVELPLAQPDASPRHLTSQYYYGIGIRPVYKSYPIYPPDKEPAGYIDWLKQQEPQIVFDPATLKTPEDWIRAGELVFEAPSAYGHILGVAGDLYVRDPEWQREVAPPL